MPCPPTPGQGLMMPQDGIKDRKIPDPILHVAECELCGWSGPDEQVIGGLRKDAQGVWRKTMPQCPQCKEKRNRARGEMIGKRMVYSSCITYFAVHQTCGVGHLSNISCPEKCPSLNCYRPKGRCRKTRCQKPDIVANDESCKACEVRANQGLEGQCPRCANERAKNTRCQKPATSEQPRGIN